MAARSRRGTSAAGESMEGCITVAKMRPLSDKKMGAKRKRSTPPSHPPPYLMEEIVTQILVQLPVKSLLRFRAVCKAWKAIIDDPAFIREHLHHSATKTEQDPCLVFSPHTLDYIIPEDHNRWPTTFSTHISFYQWRWPQGRGAASKHKVAKFLDAKDFGYRFSQIQRFAHYDGLVYAPTDTSLFVFNPATRDVITLPRTGRNNLILRRQTTCFCSGIGLDLRTGNYKVVQAFYRSMDHTSMGFDVFAIASRRPGEGRRWREMANDPPYPLHRYQTALSTGGYMFWRPDTNITISDRPCPRGLVHLSLEDEVFGIIMLPDKLEADDQFTLDVLHGSRELCLTARTHEMLLTIYTLAGVDDEFPVTWEWERRARVQVNHLYHTIALSNRRLEVILWRDYTIYSYEPVTCKLTTLCDMNRTLCDMNRIRYQGRKARKWKDLFFINVNPYTESLVRLI